MKKRALVFLFIGLILVILPFCFNFSLHFLTHPNKSLQNKGLKTHKIKKFINKQVIAQKV